MADQELGPVYELWHYPGVLARKQNCKELAFNLKVKAEIDFRCLHGDVFQHESNGIISAFKKQELILPGMLSVCVLNANNNVSQGHRHHH